MREFTLTKNSQRDVTIAITTAGAIMGLMTVYDMFRKRLRRRAFLSSPIQIISERGVTAMRPPVAYLNAVIEAAGNTYHPETNPTGLILLAVAENKLSFQKLLMPAFLAASPHPSFAGYGPMRGSLHFRELVGRLLTQRVCPGIKVPPENIVANAGLGSVLSSLFITIVEPGDACLIPAPYYAAFDNDLRALARCEPFPIHQEYPNYSLTEENLENAYNAAMKAGHRPAAVLLTNPNNPLATCYTVPELHRVVNFCKLKGMHLVSDEIYALSCFHGLSLTNKAIGLPEVPFVSMLSLLEGNLGDKVHVLWGFSKDFGASGLRVGILITQNKEVLAAMDNLSIFAACSAHTLGALSVLLADDALMERYIQENSRRLANSYDMLASWLRRMGLPFRPSTSGIFCWVDLRGLLKENSWEAETLLFESMKERGVILTPGNAQHADTPGWFRVCYAYCQVESLQEALLRLERLFFL